MDGMGKEGKYIMD